MEVGWVGGGSLSIYHIGWWEVSRSASSVGRCLGVAQAATIAGSVLLWSLSVVFVFNLWVSVIDVAQ